MDKLHNVFHSDIQRVCYDCPVNCETTSYNFKTSFRKFPAKSLPSSVLENYENKTMAIEESFLSLKVYFDELKYTNITQLPKFDALDLIASIGGYMGLLLGISFLTLVEVLEAFMTVLSHFFCKNIIID